MRWFWRRAANALLVAGSLGGGFLARPVAAEEILPPIGQSSAPKSALPRRPLLPAPDVSSPIGAPPTTPPMVPAPQPALPPLSSQSAQPSPMPRGLPIAGSH